MGAEPGTGEADTRVPRVAADWDPSRVSLTAAEGYLLSRIDGQTPWRTLLHLGGLPAEEVDRCLQRWVDQGLLTVTGSAAEPGAEGEPTADEVDAAHDDLIDESLDLSPKQQERILEFERGLDGSYFELLGVPRTADAKDIKRAYFQLSREFHPDRHYGRALGPYQARLEAIFRKLVEAYELLSDPATRIEIERSMSASPGRPAGAEKEPAEGAGSTQPRAHDKWSRLARLRKKFHVPEEVMAERRFKGRQFYEAAMVSAKKKRWLEAAASIRLAIAFDPTDRSFKSAFADVQAHVHQMRAEELIEQANASWDDRSRQEALGLYEEALLYRPSDPQMNDRAAQLCLEIRELDRALEYAEIATQVCPEVGDYHRTLGMVFRAQGLREKAKAALKEAIRLDPEDARASEQLASLREGKRKTGGMR
jgi:curved DNA-binding protein CbpA